MKACQNADLYLAMKAPTCNKGDPCDACKAKWDRAYRGVSAHEWEPVAEGTLITYRLRVTGGWLYKHGGVGMVFVPWDGRGPV